MWPLLLDMTKEESIQNLRNLELEAYSHLVSALRAQGSLNSDKRKLLKETSIALNITQERHKAEVRRAISDEKLNTIAYHVTGHTESLDDWAQEGRRLVPLLPRTAPQTAFSALADEAADVANQTNKQLPSPSSTERKRQAVPQIPPTVVPETSKSVPFRIPDPPKVEESKKRKLPVCTENSSLAQHLLAPKLCRIQQLYRQRSKPKTKELHKKVDQDQLELIQHRVMQQVQQPMQQTAMCSTPASALLGQKVNVLQNISLQPIKEELMDTDDINNISINACLKPPELIPTIPVCSNENQAPRPKIITNIKPNTNITLKQTTSLPPGPSNEVQKSIKMCSSKKPVTKTVNSGQKLIVVSNAQTIPSNSILQRTLQIPFVKNVSIKNFEKFKIVTSNSTPTSIQVTNVTNSGVNSVKHKVVTVKTNPTTKKVIPFSQLQVLNSKGSIKVLPLGGKIVGKTMAATSSPLYIMNSMGTTQPFTKSTSSSQIITTSKIQSSSVADNNSTALDGISETTVRMTRSPNRENGKSSVLEDILKASGVISEECVAEDYDTKIEEFHIPQNKIKVEFDGVEAKVIKSEEEVIVKTEEVQNYNYTVLPSQTTKENLEITELKDIYKKEDLISNELIEPESMSNQPDESKDVRIDQDDGNREESSQGVVKVECSNLSDITEPN